MSEGFASWLSGQPHLLAVVLAGLTDEMLLTSVDYEAEDADEAHGILLRMPPAPYRQVAEWISNIVQRSLQDAEFGWENLRDEQRSALAFLARRSSDAFLRTYLEAGLSICIRRRQAATGMSTVKWRFSAQVIESAA